MQDIITILDHRYNGTKWRKGKEESGGGEGGEKVSRFESLDNTLVWVLECICFHCCRWTMTGKWFGPRGFRNDHCSRLPRKVICRRFLYYNIHTDEVPWIQRDENMYLRSIPRDKFIKDLRCTRTNFLFSFFFCYSYISGLPRILSLYVFDPFYVILESLGHN